MATSRTKLTEELRQKYMIIFHDLLVKSETLNEDEFLRTGSNTFSFPVLDSEGNEEFMEITVKVPKGSKDEPYDGYLRAEDYKIKLKQDEEKAKKQAEDKAKKQARDKKLRERKAEQKAQREKEV